MANEGFISMLDMRKFPPEPTDFKDITVEVRQVPGNPIRHPCNENVDHDNLKLEASFGMSFIS